MQCHSRSVGNLLTKLSSNKIVIFHLELCKGIIDDETIEARMQMKDLLPIGFVEMIGLTNEHLIKLTNTLPKLLELHISTAPNITPSALKEVLRRRKQLTNFLTDKFCLDLKLYKEISDIVKERRKRILKISIYSFSSTGNNSCE